MTLTLTPEQLTERTAVNNESEAVTPEQTKGDAQRLVELLAQAYVAMPLFP